MLVLALDCPPPLVPFLDASIISSLFLTINSPKSSECLAACFNPVSKTPGAIIHAANTALLHFSPVTISFPAIKLIHLQLHL